MYMLLTEADREQLIEDLSEVIDDNTYRTAKMDTFEAAEACLPVIERLLADQESACRDLLEAMVNQFAQSTEKGGRAAIWSGGLGVLERAFAMLGYADPHLVPERECEQEGCYAFATAGTSTPDGDKQLCYAHYASLQAELQQSSK
jgi:hypothetical protein